MLLEDKKEQGYTLIYALLAITLIFIFSTVLIGANLNTAKQVKLTEDNVQTTHLAEMGLQFFQETLRHTFSNMDASDATTIEDARNQFVASLNGYLTDMKITVNTASDRNFQHEFTINMNPNTYYRVSYTLETAVDVNNYEAVRLTYKLTSGNSSVVETQPYESESKEFPWAKGVGLGLPDSTPAEPVASTPCDTPCNVYSDQDINIGKNKTIDALNFYAESNFTIENKSELNVSGNFYVGSTANLKNNSVIKVSNGSAYFNNINSFPNASTYVFGDVYLYGDDTNGHLIGQGSGNNNSLMCVEGTVHLLDGINIKEKDVNIIPSYRDCSYQGYNNGGIWAKGVTTFQGNFPAQPDWTSSQSGSGEEINLDPSYK